MQDLVNNIPRVYRIVIENLCTLLESSLPHLRFVADEWGQVEIKNESTTLGLITIPAVDLHHEVVYVSGHPETASMLHSILDGASNGSIKVRYVTEIPKRGKR